MNKIMVFCGENFHDANIALVRQINPFDLSKQNVVFVPSGAEDYAEKLVFDALNTPVFFGVKISTIKRFLEQTVGKTPLSTLNQKLLVRKAVKNLKGRLNLFKNITSGVIDQIFEEITRLQDAFLLPEDLENLDIKDKFLKSKVIELTEIYQEYLSLLGENFDELKLKQEFVKGAFDFESTNFYFLGFQHFSKSEQEFINALAKNKAKVFVSTINSKNQGNSYIFDEVMLENCDFKIAPKTLCENAEKISHLAFSVEDKKENLDFLRVIEANSPQEEVFMIALQIKKLLFEKRCRQQDIAVVCGNLASYQEEISKVFEEFGFDFSISQSTQVLDLGVSKFLQSVLRFLEEKSPQNFHSILVSDFSPLLESQKQFLHNLAEQRGFLKNKQEFEGLPQNLKSLIIETQEKLEEIEKTTSFSLKLKQIVQLFNIQEKQTLLSNALMTLGQEDKAYAQKVAVEKILGFCEEIEMFEGAFSLQEMVEIFENFLKETTISNAQKECSGILVCGAEEIISNSKILFVMGANQGALPSEKNDTCILTDSNLKTLGLDILTVTSQNRISRRRVLNSITSFEDLLFISYSHADLTGQKLLPSGFVKSLCEVAKNNVVKDLSKTFFDDAESLPLEKKAEIFAQMLGTVQNAKKSYIKLVKTGDKEFCDVLLSLKDALSFSQKKHIDDGLAGVDKKALFFPDNKTKVSQIEAYYACPFRHFLAYGLKLKEKSKPKFMAVDTGNLLHKIAEEFLSEKNTYVLNDDVETSVEEIFETLKTQPKFEKVFYEENEVSLEILKDEAVRFCKFLKSTKTKSNFKPKFLEVYFGKTQKFTLKVRGEDFSLVGIVDRVDVFNDGAVVIDYKTSSHAQGKNQELFYGEKIQIFVYAKALEVLFNLKPQGVYYFPITNDFFDVGKAKPYMLAGKNVKSEDFLSNFDTTLTYDNPKSKIFPCSIKTSKEVRQQGIVEYASNNAHEEQKHFDAMIDYAVKLVENAIKEILDGSFKVNPRKDACKYCPYASICQKNKVTKERLLDFEVNSPTFWAVLEGEDNGKDTV